MTRPSWPYLPQSLLRLQHMFLPHPRDKCLFTDCPVVINDSVTCVNYASSLGMSFHLSSSRHWWCSDMCQSCVYIGNGKFTDCPVVSNDSVTCVYIRNVCSPGDCPVVIDDSVTCVSHVSTLGKASSPIVQSSLMTQWYVSVMCPH